MLWVALLNKYWLIDWLDQKRLLKTLLLEIGGCAFCCIVWPDPQNCHYWFLLWSLSPPNIQSRKLSVMIKPIFCFWVHLLQRNSSLCAWNSHVCAKSGNLLPLNCTWIPDVLPSLLRSLCRPSFHLFHLILRQQSLFQPHTPRPHTLPVGLHVFKESSTSSNSQFLT